MVDGIFLATEKEVKELIGKEVYFGEVLGKHSEIYGTIDVGDITELDVTPQTINDLAKFGTLSGYNPLEYWEEGR